MKKRSSFRRAVAVLLSLSLILATLVPFAAFAEPIPAANRGILFVRMASASPGNLNWDGSMTHADHWMEFDVTVAGTHTLTLPGWPRSDTLWVEASNGVIFLDPHPIATGRSVVLDEITIDGDVRFAPDAPITTTGGNFWNTDAGYFFDNIPLAGGGPVTSIPGYTMREFRIPVEGNPNYPIDAWSNAGTSPLGTINTGDVMTVTFTVTPGETGGTEPVEITRPLNDPRMPTMGVGGNDNGYDFEEDTKFIGLTFDDGPHAGITPQVLDKLAYLGATATFYINPAHINATTRPIVQRMIDEGHCVDHHGWDHTSFGIPIVGGYHPTRAAAIEDLELAAQTIFDETGFWPFSFRAPFFQWGRPAGHELGQLNMVGLDYIYRMPFVGSGLDPDDWQLDATAEMIAQRILDTRAPVGSHEGVNILLHDGGGARQETVDSLELFIPQLRAEGYEFVSIRQLMILTETMPHTLPSGNYTGPGINGFAPPRGAGTPLWPNYPTWWDNDEWWTDDTPPWYRIPLLTVEESEAHVDLTGQRRHLPDSTVTINAGLRHGHIFDGWVTADGIVFADETERITTITMPATSATVTATWTARTDPSFDVVLQETGVGATGAGEYWEDEIVEIFAGTRTGYDFASWEVVEGGPLPDLTANNATATFTMPANDVTLEAIWTPWAAQNYAVGFVNIFSAAPSGTYPGFSSGTSPQVRFNITEHGDHVLTLPAWPSGGTGNLNPDHANILFVQPTLAGNANRLPVSLLSFAIDGVVVPLDLSPANISPGWWLPTPTPTLPTVPPFTWTTGGAASFAADLADNNLELRSFNLPAATITIPAGALVTITFRVGNGSVTGNDDAITPDFECANFLAFVRSLDGVPATGDIYAHHVSGITTISASNSGITCLSGVEHFSDVENIIVQGNNLTELDVSGRPNLRHLNASNNNLTSLDVSGAVALEALSISRNGMVTITGLGALENLRVFWAEANAFSSLAFYQDAPLERVDVRGNTPALTRADITGATAQALLDFNIAEIFRPRTWARLRILSGLAL